MEYLILKVGKVSFDPLLWLTVDLVALSESMSFAVPFKERDGAQMFWCYTSKLQISL